MKNRLIGSALVLTAGLMFSSTGSAQVGEQSRDVKAQAADATRDLSGTWLLREANASFSKEQPPPMTPWAMERFKANRPTMGPNGSLDANDPTLDCFPPGVPYVFVVPTPVEIVQTPDRVIQLFEYNRSIRRIYTDGRQHPKDLQDTGTYEWMGHSIGWWEGDTFVIDTIGFNDKTWLDRLGRPHSDALHVVEHVRRVGRDTLEYNVTVEDPKAYTNPWNGQMIFELRPDWGVFEHVCTSGSEKYLQYKAEAWAPSK